MFINRDRWDNAEKVLKAHVGKEKHFSSSRIVGSRRNDSRRNWVKPFQVWMLTSLTNFVGNLGHCGCLSVILIWNGGVVWPESELQRDRMLGRQALNRNMCLRKKAVFPLAEAVSVDQPEELAWRAAFPAGMNLWLGLYWFCYVAWTKLPRHDKNTWQ